MGGGGRYDGLSEMIGGPSLPSVGWALGVDRAVLALEAEGIELDIPSATSVFAVPLGEEARRILFAKVATELRKNGVAANSSYGDTGRPASRRRPRAQGPAPPWC
ncbi:histidine--tRNA ligase [Streptomyces violaceorubidus]